MPHFGQFGVTEKQALQIVACFGGGMNKGEVCGACTGALMVLGMKSGQTDPNDPNVQDSLMNDGKFRFE